MIKDYENFFEYTDGYGGRHHCLQKVEESRLQFFVRAASCANQHPVELHYDRGVFWIRTEKNELSILTKGKTIFDIKDNEVFEKI